MNSNVKNKLKLIAIKKSEEGGFLPNGVDEVELSVFLSSCKAELGGEPPQDYLEFLKLHNGLTVEGVFVYSTKRLPIVGSTAKTLAFVEMNVISRDVEELKGFLVFGDSDQDEYVLDLSTGMYQVRDKQAFDNVYEEFECFDDLLLFMLDLALRRIG